MEYKGYNIDGDGVWGLRVIKPTTKGSVPGELRGSFTTNSFAERAIDLFLMNKEIANGGKKADIT